MIMNLTQKLNKKLEWEDIETKDLQRGDIFRTISSSSSKPRIHIAEAVEVKGHRVQIDLVDLYTFKDD